MSDFALSFCVCLFHSLWQSAVLLLLYFFKIKIFHVQDPRFKKNILLGLLFIQVITSIITFLENYIEIPSSAYTNSLVNLPWLAVNEILLRHSTFILFGYIIFLLVNFARLFSKWKSLCAIKSLKGFRTPVGLKLFVINKSRQLGIKRKVLLCLNDSVVSPMTFGFLKPVIILPIALLNQLSISETEAILVHELAHIRHNDYLLNWLILLIHTIFYFNPFIRIICDLIRLEREKDCDLQVIQFNYSAITYAESLVKAAKVFSTKNVFTLGAAVKNAFLLKRIMFFSKNNDLNRTHYTGAISFVFLFTGLLINGMFLHPETIRLQQMPAHNGQLQRAHKIVYQNIFPRNLRLSAPQTQLSDLKRQTILQGGNIPKNNKQKIIIDRYLDSGEKINNLGIAATDITGVEKYVTVSEEISGKAQKITKVYKLKWENGIWRKDLVLLIKQGKHLADSVGNSRGKLTTPAMQ